MFPQAPRKEADAGAQVQTGGFRCGFDGPGVGDLSRCRIDHLQVDGHIGRLLLAADGKAHDSDPSAGPARVLFKSGNRSGNQILGSLDFTQFGFGFRINSAGSPQVLLPQNRIDLLPFQHLKNLHVRQLCGQHVLQFMTHVPAPPARRRLVGETENAYPGLFRGKC